MKALTLQQPFAWALVHGPKRIENRSWPPPPWIVGKVIAIHAARSRPFFDDVDLVRDLAGEATPEEFDLSAVIGVARVVGFVRDTGQGMEVSSGLDRRLLTLEWYVDGQYGWVFDSVRALRVPIGCTGALKLWDLPRDVEAELRSYL